MSRPFSAFTGESAYLDTMIFYALVRNIDIDVVKPLFRQIREGKWQAFTSALTFDELAYRLLLALIKDNHDKHPLELLRNDEAGMIATYYPQVAAALEQLQTFPNLTILDVTVADLTAMHDLALEYHLRPRDALHLSAMYKCDCLNLVSNDGDFDQVPLIQRFTLS
jgi:predicted nucleic acid-binding protein